MSRRMTLPYAGLLALAAVLALAGFSAILPAPPTTAPSAAPGPEPGDETRELLERWRADPDRHARLSHEWRALQALPPERRERMRALDWELHAEEPAAQAHLWGVLERYAAWLERLPEADRREVIAAADADARLRVIRALRDRDYVARLPRAVRDKVEATPAGEERAALVARLRAQDRERRAEWMKAWRPPWLAGGPQPAQLGQFPAEVQEFVRKSLLPALGEEEKRRLAAAEGHWPAYARTLWVLSEKYPALLPPGAADTPGPTGPQGLPRPFRDQLAAGRKMEPGQRVLLRQAEGKWPQYALAVVEVARARGLTVPPEVFARCPRRPGDFTPAVRQFLDRDLLPRLHPAEREELARLEGRWPGYPRKLMALAAAHGLVVPGTRLPGPPELWDRVRVEAPVAPAAPGAGPAAGARPRQETPGGSANPGR